MTDIPPDVRALVIAGRIIAYQDDGADADDHRQLDKALEAFANRVPWDDQPTPLPGTTPTGSSGGEVDRIAALLLDTWKRVDPDSGVAKHPTSYVANFADMARAVIATQPSPEEGGATPIEAHTYVASLEPYRFIDDCGNPGLSYSAQQVRQAYIAGANRDRS